MPSTDWVPLGFLGFTDRSLTVAFRPHRHPPRMALEWMRQRSELEAAETEWRAELVDDQRRAFLAFRNHALPLFILRHEEPLPGEARSLLCEGELIAYGGPGPDGLFRSPLLDCPDTRLDRFLPPAMQLQRMYGRQLRSRVRLYDTTQRAWSETVERQAHALLQDYRRKRRAQVIAVENHGLCGCGHHSCELCSHVHSDSE